MRILPVALAAGLMFAGSACTINEAAPVAPAVKAKSGSPVAEYFCPMDKEITSDKPGSCSKCGMKLELRK